MAAPWRRRPDPPPEPDPPGKMTFTCTGCGKTYDTLSEAVACANSHPAPGR